MRLILTRKTMIFIFEGWPRSAPQQETFRGYQANAEFIRQEEMSCSRQSVRLIPSNFYIYRGALRV